MKNQFFGDIHDYRKYGLLRILSGEGALRTAVCWMLTEDDGQNHGRATGYLQAPDLWRTLDPELYDSLVRSLGNHAARHVRSAQIEGMLPSAVYYDRLLTDDGTARRDYFEEFKAVSQGSDLAFFDPDNGLEVASVRPGKRGSSRYLYWDEATAVFRGGQSVLVYQHFPRQSRQVLTEALAQELLKRPGAAEVTCFRTAHVLFLLLGQDRHANHFRQQSGQVEEVWRDQIRVTHHCSSPAAPSPGLLSPRPYTPWPGEGGLDALPAVLRQAGEAVIAGDDPEVRALLEQLKRNSPATAELTGRRVPHAVQLGIFLRDQFQCTYCGKKTVFVPVLRVVSELYPQGLPFHSNWKWSECHPVYWTHGTSCDHLVPLARRGSSQPGNLVTACYMCNSMKQNWLLEELRWALTVPVVLAWDGLTGLYPALCRAAGLQQHAYHRPWLLALEQSRAAAVQATSSEG